MEILKVNGKSYNVLIISMSEEFNILYRESTGRTIADGARMFLDPIGTFFGHRITFKRRKGYEKEFDELFDFFSIPRTDGFLIEAVHGQNSISYEAYVSNGARNLNRVRNEIAEWGEMSINFIPMEAQVLPEWSEG